MKQMKAIRYITAAAAALLLAACSESGELATEANFPSDGIVRVTTEVAQPTSRTDGYSTYTGSTMGLGIAYDNNSLNTYNRPNVQWNYNSGTAEWTASSTMLWKDATTSANVYAYAPYVSGPSSQDDMKDISFSVSTDQSSGITSSDLVGYAAASFVPGTNLSTDKTIPVQLKHKMAMVTVNLTYGSEFDSNIAKTINAVKIKNAGTTVQYDATTATCSTAAVSNTGDISMHAAVAFTEYQAIVPAQTLKAEQCGINIIFASNYDNGSRTFSCTLPSDLTLEAGSNYALNLTVGRDGLRLNDVSVSAWATPTELTDGAKKSVEYDAHSHSITINEPGSLQYYNDYGNNSNTIVASALNGTTILHVYGSMKDADFGVFRDYMPKGCIVDLRNVTLNCGQETLIYSTEAPYIIITPEQYAANCYYLDGNNVKQPGLWSEGSSDPTKSNYFPNHILFVGRDLDHRLNEPTTLITTAGNNPAKGYILQIADDLKSYTAVIKYSTEVTWDAANTYATNYNTSASSRLINYDNDPGGETYAIANNAALTTYMGTSSDYWYNEMNYYMQWLESKFNGGFIDNTVNRQSLIVQTFSIP